MHLLKTSTSNINYSKRIIVKPSSSLTKLITSQCNGNSQFLQAVVVHTHITIFLNQTSRERSQLNVLKIIKAYATETFSERTMLPPLYSFLFLAIKATVAPTAVMTMYISTKADYNSSSHIIPFNVNIKLK